MKTFLLNNKQYSVQDDQWVCGIGSYTIITDSSYLELFQELTRNLNLPVNLIVPSVRIKGRQLKAINAKSNGFQALTEGKIGFIITFDTLKTIKTIDNTLSLKEIINNLSNQL